jgi:hypothetical protein
MWPQDTSVAPATVVPEHIAEPEHCGAHNAIVAHFAG